MWPGQNDQYYSVVLNHPGPHRVPVLKAIRTLRPELGLADVKQFILHTPCVVCQCPFRDEANQAGLDLQALGADVKIISPDGDELQPEVWVPMEIPPEHLETLRKSGLVVTDPEPPIDSYSRIYVGVDKPKEIKGNSLPGHEHWCRDRGVEVLMDAPGVSLYGEYGHWIVRVHECIPGPGPGDFRNQHDHIEEALADILDYYFGDPVRVQRQRSDEGPTREEVLARDKTDEPCRVDGCRDQRITCSAFCPQHHLQMLGGHL